MSDSKTDWPSDLILEFIDLYEQHSVLWDPDNSDRNNRKKVHEAWSSIQRELSTRFDITDLKRKKESLLATYRMLKRKLLTSQKNSDDGVETYQPTWFAYQSLDKFLNANRRLSAANYLRLSANSPPKDPEKPPLKRAAASNHNYCDSESEDEQEAEEVRKVEPPKAKVATCLREPLVFGQSVGLQLSEVEKNQRIIAERVISEVLFYARLGNLTESSTVIVSQWAEEEDVQEEEDEG